MDITLTGIPDSITEQQVKEWVSVLVERSLEAKVNSIPEVATAMAEAKASVDSFRASNNLTLKFSKTAVKAKEVV